MVSSASSAPSASVHHIHTPHWLLRNRELLLHDDATGIDVMVEEEGGDTRLLLTIDHSPVDWGSTTILWQAGLHAH